MNCVKPEQPTSGSTSSRNVRPMPASWSGCVAKLTVTRRVPSAGVSASAGVGASTTSATSGSGPSFSIEYDSPEAM